jgi:hypothetical protein
VRDKREIHKMQEVLRKARIMDNSEEDGEGKDCDQGFV